MNAPHRTPIRTTTLFVVSFGLVLAALPVFLVGGLAVQIRAELGFSETELGAAVTTAFLLAAAAGPIGGRISDRIGARAAVMVGSLMSVAAMAGIGLGARNLAHVVLSLAVAGVAFAFTDPGLAIFVTRAVPPQRRGLAFGVKEASIPISTLAAGLAVPAIALTAGWRWAFLIGVVPLVGLAILLPRSQLDQPLTATPGEDHHRRKIEGSPRRALRTAATAAALGTAAASGVTVFLTESAVAMGLSPAGAGFLLAGGSIAGVITRVAAGIWADRQGGEQLGLIAVLLGLGGVSMLIGATGTGVLLVVGTVGAFAGGWGWSGLFFLSLVRVRPDAPGAASGIGLTGLAIGNALGPLLFGVTAQTLSFSWAWLGAALMVSTAALLMRRSHLVLRTPTGGRASDPPGCNHR